MHKEVNRVVYTWYELENDVRKRLSKMTLIWPLDYR